jgi:hypothetical protein
LQPRLGYQNGRVFGVARLGASLFLTMKDNETLSGARDTEGARGLSWFTGT